MYILMSIKPKFAQLILQGKKTVEIRRTNIKATKGDKVAIYASSPQKQIVGEEITPFVEISDLIIPIEVDGVKTYSQSMEYIRVQKEKYLREKDIDDINFINRVGINTNNYNKVKTSFENAKVQLQNYSNNHLSNTESHK